MQDINKPGYTGIVREKPLRNNLKLQEVRGKYLAKSLYFHGNFGHFFCKVNLQFCENISMENLFAFACMYLYCQQCPAGRQIVTHEKSCLIIQQLSPRMNHKMPKLIHTPPVDALEFSRSTWKRLPVQMIRKKKQNISYTQYFEVLPELKSDSQSGSQIPISSPYFVQLQVKVNNIDNFQYYIPSSASGISSSSKTFYIFEFYVV